MQLFLKILSEMANSVDLIRLLLWEQSDLGLHCLHNNAISSGTLMYEILGHLLYILCKIN